jgi:hypothetical protein
MHVYDYYQRHKKWGGGGHTKPQNSKDISKESEGNGREFSSLRHM